MGWAVVSSVSSTEVAEDGQRAGELEISFSILNILWKNKLRAAGGTTRFAPAISSEARAAKLESWRAAVEATYGWADRG